MAQEFSRTRRVGEQIQQILAQAIQRELKDPRIGMVTITAVEVSKEFEHATVYYTVLGDEQQKESTGVGLQHAAGFLRNELARRLKLRTTPRLQFAYDRSVEEGNRLSSLIDSAVASDKQKHKE
jgi:ribosome-binding factor A